MAIPDLLWACPECGEDGGLQPGGKDARCRACGTRFQRERGAAIRAVRPDGTSEIRSPAEWLDRLPHPRDIVGKGRSDAPIRAAKVDISEVTGHEAVHGETGYLNRIELWGEESPGTLALWRDRLVVAPEDHSPDDWPLETLTAVQTSSSSLQLKRSGAPLVSFRFHADSSFFWERLVRAALRDFYGRTGRGEIVEFQPRIVTA
ncbi:MAG: hypothetical protein GWM90_26110 [Gemmatimonadetes bacterium]|nr:hypothetical protein [Gemmatimonadota bacterium]NIQ58361.1 hypothetical protein [Gemmatimonadota bacterium]NIU78579.1 hypothetical protein [Gammaproteobacteria bacterium]NIX47421.1 hypothetical protein [Gemmatimonadota bacterium]NIY11805.1 hypothetical protein [Gemmatimonadota bacterium]